jgi:hypothetical protein
MEHGCARCEESSALPLRTHFHGSSKNHDESNEQDSLDIIELEQNKSRVDELQKESAASEELGEVGEEHGDRDSSDLDELHKDKESIDIYANRAFEADEDVQENLLPSKYAQHTKKRWLLTISEQISSKAISFWSDAYVHGATQQCLLLKTAHPRSNKQ